MNPITTVVPSHRFDMAASFLAVVLFCCMASSSGQLNMRFLRVSSTPPFESAYLPFRTSMIVPGVRPLSRLPVQDANDPIYETVDETPSTATPDWDETTTDANPTTSDDEWTTTPTPLSTSTTVGIDIRNSTLMTGYFRRCCARKQLPQGCVDQCSFDTLDNGRRRSIVSARCPLRFLPQIMACMSNGRDNTACCARSDAFRRRKSLLDICRPLCYPSSPQFPKKAGGLVRFAPCQAVGAEIGLCHMLNYV